MHEQSHLNEVERLNEIFTERLRREKEKFSNIPMNALEREQSRVELRNYDYVDVNELSYPYPKHNHTFITFNKSFSDGVIGIREVAGYLIVDNHSTFIKIPEINLVSLRNVFVV